MRFFIFFSYDGTAYHGWQIQPNGVTVQEKLQGCLSILLRKPMEVTGAGRTDTGVHAKLMVAHFDAEGLLGEELVGRLNRILPQDIAVKAIRPVRDDAHARFSACSRTYKYFVYTEKSPFRRRFALELNHELDFERMNHAAALLLETLDFTSFSKVHTDVKTKFCKVTKAEWREVQPGFWAFEITSDRFLRNMVRAIVGTLIEVGRGRLSLDGFARIIRQQDRCAAGESMPAKALFLTDIAYPEDLFLD